MRARHLSGRGRQTADTSVSPTATMQVSARDPVADTQTAFVLAPVPALWVPKANLSYLVAMPRQAFCLLISRSTVFLS
jgi:hypothetical protein